jgi:hypothetical protein
VFGGLAYKHVHLEVMMNLRLLIIEEFFLEMIRLMGRLNVDIDDVVLEKALKNAKYTLPTIQKEILHILANKVRKKICEEVRDAKFCILVDEAKDASNKEQMAIVLRFVDI